MVEFCLGKEKEKSLGAGEEAGDQWEGKIILYFGVVLIIFNDGVHVIT